MQASVLARRGRSNDLGCECSRLDERPGNVVEHENLVQDHQRLPARVGMLRRKSEGMPEASSTGGASTNAGEELHHGLRNHGLEGRERVHPSSRRPSTAGRIYEHLAVLEPVVLRVVA
jgi:hypothetical protein